MSLLDPFDFDTATPEIARINNVPERWMADLDLTPEQLVEKFTRPAQGATSHDDQTTAA
jgi:hypothetical protein